MKEYASKLLDKALDAIEAAEGLTNMGKAEIAAGRAYYAMFYVAEALLYNEFDLKLNQHGQVIAAYGKNFAKTKALDPKYHRWLRDGFDKRISGDYGVDTGISESIVADMINHARDFLMDAKKYMESQNESE
ncbi:MAG: HEPN domain-containing protein [Chloroflexi bacterium]|nr:HEPN domain-containing protein [Chloroflexota bacterium]